MSWGALQFGLALHLCIPVCPCLPPDQREQTSPSHPGSQRLALVRFVNWIRSPESSLCPALST